MNKNLRFMLDLAMLMAIGYTVGTIGVATNTPFIMIFITSFVLGVIYSITTNRRN